MAFHADFFLYRMVVEISRQAGVRFSTATFVDLRGSELLVSRRPVVALVLPSRLAPCPARRLSASSRVAFVVVAGAAGESGGSTDNGRSWHRIESRRRGTAHLAAEFHALLSALRQVTPGQTSS